MNIYKTIIIVFCYILLSFQPVFAAIITASTTNISGNIWESRYTITNNTPSAIKWFTIYFQFDLYENFYFDASELGAEWDVYAAEPVLSSDGFVDAYTEGDGIAVGESLTNLIVRYNFLGQNQPALQSFEVYDPDFIEPTLIDQGGVDISVVPEPASLLLFGLGFIALVITRKYNGQLPKLRI